MQHVPLRTTRNIHIAVVRTDTVSQDVQIKSSVSAVPQLLKTSGTNHSFLHAAPAGTRARNSSQQTAVISAQTSILHEHAKRCPQDDKPNSRCRELLTPVVAGLRACTNQQRQTSPFVCLQTSKNTNRPAEHKRRGTQRVLVRCCAFTTKTQSEKQQEDPSTDIITPTLDNNRQRPNHALATLTVKIIIRAHAQNKNKKRYPS